jgi:hypothetical protein
MMNPRAKWKKGRASAKPPYSKRTVLAPANLIAHLPLLEDVADTLPNDYTIVVLPRSRRHQLKQFIS